MAESYDGKAIMGAQLQSLAEEIERDKVSHTSVTALADWDTLTDTGIYEIASQASGVAHSPESGNMTLIVMKASSFITQTAVGKEVYKRCYTSGSWTDWQRCNEFVTTYNSSTPTFAATKTAYDSGADIICIERESGQGGTFDHVARLQEVVYENGAISKFVFAISRCLNASNTGEIVKYEYASGGWTKTVSKVVEAEYVRQQHENEINFKNVPATVDGTNISRVWFNYRHGDSDSLDQNKLITEYCFGNRGGGTGGVKLVAEEFSGKANSAENYVYGGLTRSIGEALNGVTGAYMLLYNNGWGMFPNDGMTEIASGNVGQGYDIFSPINLNEVVYKAMGFDNHSSTANRRRVTDIINIADFSAMHTDYTTMRPGLAWVNNSQGGPQYVEWPQRVKIKLTLANTKNAATPIYIRAGGRLAAANYLNHGTIIYNGSVTETPTSGDPREWSDNVYAETSIGTIGANASKTWEIMYWKVSSGYAYVDYHEYVVVNTIY